MTNVPDWLEKILDVIDATLSETKGKNWDSPFSNTGNSYENSTFEVDAYRWEDELPGPTRPKDYNFKWKDIKISWYKHSHRGLEMNRSMTIEEGATMLQECINSIFENNE